MKTMSEADKRDTDWAYLLDQADEQIDDQAQAITALTAERDALKESGQLVLTYLEACDWWSEKPELNGAMHEAIQKLRASLGQRNTMGIPLALKGQS